MIRRLPVLVAAVLLAALRTTPALAVDERPCGPQKPRVHSYVNLTVQDCAIWIPRRLGSVPLWRFTPVAQEAGRLDKGRPGPNGHWFICQRSGPTGAEGDLRNRWWALAVADNGRAGWLGQVYLRGGGPNEPDGGLRHCTAPDVAYAQRTGAGDPSGAPEVLPPALIPVPARAAPAPQPKRPGEIGRSQERREPKQEPDCYSPRNNRVVTVRFGMRQQLASYDPKTVPPSRPSRPVVQRPRAGTLNLEVQACRTTKRGPGRWFVGGTMDADYESVGVNNDGELRGNRFSRGLIIGVTRATNAQDPGVPVRITVQTVACRNPYWPTVAATAVETIAELPLPTGKLFKTAKQATLWGVAKIAPAARKRFIKLNCQKVAVHDVAVQPDNDGIVRAWTEDREVPIPRVVNTPGALGTVNEYRYEVDHPEVSIRN